jgi:hypothetical protein
MVTAVVPDVVTRIEGLPEHLCVVPPAPNNEYDPDGDAKRAAWQAWSFGLVQYRIARRKELHEHPDLIKIEMRKCTFSVAYFMAVWGCIFEPRHDPENGILGGDKPWLPFEVQIQLLDWINQCMNSSGTDRDGIVSKCRDMGATWTMCLYLTHGWLFKYPFNALLLSRNQSLVDSKSDDSMFSKIEFILNNLPAWMMPAGFSLKDKRYNSELMLMNPETRAQIKGESTNSNAGRSGRYTLIVVDEAAFVPELSHVWAGLGATTFHRFAVSSESLKEGPTFWNLGVNNKNPVGKKPALFEMNWWDHPLHTVEWLNAERDRYAANNQMDEFEQEYMRNPRAGDRNWVYPYASSLQIDSEVGLIDMGHLYASIDPGQRDQTAIVWIQEQGDKFAVVGAYESSGKPAAFYVSIITGVPDFTAEWVYTSADLQFMEWTAKLPTQYLRNGSFFGDVSGHSVFGATMDSFYSVLEKGGIFVNKDRMPDGQAIGYRREARTHKGRQEALRSMLPSFTFSNDYNAPYALRCLQENKYPPETGNAMTESRAAKHDDSSHIVTAFEYFAVHRKMAHSMDLLSEKRQKRRGEQNSRDLNRNDPNFRDWGRVSRRAGTR